MNIILQIILVTAILEIITIVSRLYFGEMNTYWKKYSPIKFRIHHGYVGFILLLGTLMFQIHPILLIIAIALIFSDIAHHLIAIPVLSRVFNK